MAGANDIACADDADVQFVIILLRHASIAMSILRNQRLLRETNLTAPDS